MPHALLAEGPDDYWQYSDRQYSDGLFPIETKQPGPG